MLLLRAKARANTTSMDIALSVTGGISRLLIASPRVPQRAGALEWAVIATPRASRYAKEFLRVPHVQLYRKNPGRSVCSALVSLSPARSAMRGAPTFDGSLSRLKACAMQASELAAVSLFRDEYPETCPAHPSLTPSN